MGGVAGKAAIVTGASRGIGAAAARALAGTGARVVLAARSLDECRALAGEIGGDAFAVSCDVSRYGDLTDAVEACRSRFGSLDILVNNAGVIDPLGRMAESDPDEWSSAIDTNLKGVYFGMRAALPVMIEQGGGVIVNVGSGAAHRPLEGWGHYCAAKAGAAMLTRSAHLEYGGAGVKVVGFAPGTVATYMQEAIRASGLSHLSRLPPSAHSDPMLPGRAIAWLAGPGAEEFAGEEASLGDARIQAALRNAP